MRCEAQDGSYNPAEAPTRNKLQNGKATANAVRRRPAAATSTPMRANREKKNRPPVPDIPIETPSKKPRLSEEAKPMMPIEGEKVQYRGATVDMCLESRDYYWRIKFPAGTIPSRAKALVFLHIYIYIREHVQSYSV